MVYLHNDAESDSTILSNPKRGHLAGPSLGFATSWLTIRETILVTLYIMLSEDYRVLEWLEVCARGFLLHRRDTDKEYAHYRVLGGCSSMTPSPHALLVS